MGAVGSAVGGAIGLGQGLFGQGQTQQQAQNVIERLQMRPEDIQRIQQQLGQVQARTQQVGGLAQQLQQQALAGAPQLQAIQAPQFATELDPFARRLAARGTEQLQQQAAARQRQVQQQLGGVQPGVARALALQAGQQAQLQANPLLMAAAQEQQARQLGQQQLMMQAAQAENQRRLAEAQAAAQARGEAFGFGGAGLTAEQSLLNILSQLGQQFGERQRLAQAQTRGRTGGLLTGVF